MVIKTNDFRDIVYFQDRRSSEASGVKDTFFRYYKTNFANWSFHDGYNRGDYLCDQRTLELIKRMHYY